jgi:lambda family phage minor tail protein L
MRPEQLTGANKIELIDLDLNSIGVNAVLRFFNEQQTNGTAVAYQGNTYTPWPIQTSGFEDSTGLESATPSITTANYGAVTALFVNYDLRNCEVVRHVIYESDLDGMPGANPNNYLSRKTWYVSRTGDNQITAFVALRNALEIRGIEIPRRKMYELLEGVA